MLAIYKKELKSYFTSVIACLYIAITSLIMGGFFVMYNLNYGTPYIVYAVSNALLIMVFTIPVLTMKVFADELKQKTDQLLMTAPVSLGKIVWGKYAALVTIYVVPVLIACTYPLILSSFGRVPMRLSYVEIFGMLIYGCALIAIGMFISSITESQVIAAILSIVVMFAGYMMPNISSTVSTEGNIITKVLNVFDLISPANSFMNGVFEIKSVIYYISLVLLFLFLTTQSLQKRRWTVSRKTISTSVFNSGFIAVAVAVAVFVNLFAVKAAENAEWMSIDMTDQKLYTLSDDTEKLLDKVSDEIKIYVLGTKDSLDETVAQTLTKYEKACNKISVEYKDTKKYPNFYKTYIDTAPSANSIIVENAKANKTKVIDANDMYEYDYDYSSYTSTVTGYDGEGQITSAIDYVTSTNGAVIYSVTGHNEQGVGNAFTSAIEKMNITVEEVNLFEHDKITTDDCDMMMLLSPENDYSKDEADKVIEYLKLGGRVLMTTSYNGNEYTNFNSIANYYGIEVTDGIVSELDPNAYYQSPFYILSSEGEGFASGLTNYIISGYDQALNVDEKNKNYRDTVTYSKFMKTSDDAICKIDPNNMETYEKEEGDVDGPFDLGVSVEENVDVEDSTAQATAKLCIIGSSTIFTDDYNSMVADTNLTVFKNILNDYIDEVAESVSIPVKEVQFANLTMTSASSKVTGLVVAFLIPIFVLIAGIVIWVRRRRL